MSAVLDASALLAYLQQEAGAENVKAAIGRAVISTVNWAETVQKTLPTTDEAAELRQGLQSLGLALGDRACLAVGMEDGRTVYTADRVWQKLGLDVEIRTIR